jgi:hypothetical protein
MRARSMDEFEPTVSSPSSPSFLAELTLACDSGALGSAPARRAAPEGRALIAWLQRQGVSFLAFRGPVRGTATGAHVHIGEPSPRRAG